MAIGFFIVLKKVIFSLMARPLPTRPPPLLMALPLVDELFLGFPKVFFKDPDPETV